MGGLVFVSHSCNQDPLQLSAGDPKRTRLERARAVRSAIIELLGDRVWLDGERLQAGDPWRLEIFRALYRCSAAVILLDEDAFASPWVRQEATILNFRRRLNPGFVMIPVLLDEGSSSRFDEGDWKPLALRDLMALKNSPDQIADEVATRLSEVEELEDPDLDYWVSALGGKLREVASKSPERLTAACGELGISTEDWAADNASGIRPFAQALLSAKPKVVAAVANLHLKPAVADAETRRTMRRLLVPIWVSLAAAGCAAAALRKPPSERRALLNTADENVAAEHVDRAVSCAEGVLQVRSHGVVGEDPQELFSELVQLVIDACPPLQFDPSRENFATWLSDYPYRRPVLFVRPVFPVAQLADLLDQLADRFPGLTVFVLDANTKRTPGDLALLHATVIEPPLDAVTEQSANLYRGELKLFARE